MTRVCRPGIVTTCLLVLALLAACASEAPSAPAAEAPLTPISSPAATPISSPTTTPTTAPPPDAADEHDLSDRTDRSITIAAVGDLMLARDVATQMADGGAVAPFVRVLPMLEDADLVIGNLEGTFTDRGEPLDKKYTFRTPPQLVNGLALAGFDAVSLANNHSFDFGAIGLADTIDALKSVGVEPFGGGVDEAAAYAPVIFEVEGQTVAILGFNAVGGTSVARTDEPGVAWADEDAIAAVLAAAARADYVVVMQHAGIEYAAVPSLGQMEFARSVIEAGADVVVGHHPHTLQPWQAYEGGLILSSLGNFVFDLDAGDLETLGRAPFESAIAMITLSVGSPPQVVVRPVMIDVDENRPRPATLDELPAILERVGTEWPWQTVVPDSGWTSGPLAAREPPSATPLRAAPAGSPRSADGVGREHLSLRDPRSASLVGVPHRRFEFDRIERA